MTGSTRLLTSWVSWGILLEAGTDSTSAHMDELMDQARVLRNLVSEIRMISSGMKEFL